MEECCLVSNIPEFLNVCVYVCMSVHEFCVCVYLCHTCIATGVCVCQGADMAGRRHSGNSTAGHWKLRDHIPLLSAHTNTHIHTCYECIIYVT